MSQAYCNCLHPRNTTYHKVDVNREGTCSLCDYEVVWTSHHERFPRASINSKGSTHGYRPTSIKLTMWYEKGYGKLERDIVRKDL